MTRHIRQGQNPTREQEERKEGAEEPHMRSRLPPLGRRVRLTLFSGAGIGVLVLTLGFDSANPLQASATTDPVIAAAGDIACDPTSSSFNGGLGTSGSC